MQNIIVILKIGTKLGFIAGTLPLTEKILCRVTALTGLATVTHYIQDYPPQKRKTLHLNSPSSGLSWPTD